MFIIPRKLEPGEDGGAPWAHVGRHPVEWDDDEGAWMVVVRKSDLSIAHAGEIPSMSTYHFAGAYETNDEIRVLVNELAVDASTSARFSDMYWRSGRRTGTILSEYAADARRGAVKSPVVPRARGERRLGGLREQLDGVPGD